MLFLMLAPNNVYAATTSATYDFENSIKDWYKNGHGSDVSLTVTNGVFDNVEAFSFNGKFGSSYAGGWHLRSRGNDSWGLQNTESGGRNLKVLDLQNGDIVYIYGYNGNNNNEDLVVNATSNANYTFFDQTSNTYTFTMKADGDLSVTIGRSAMVRSITIVHENNTPSLSFSSSSATGELSSLNFPEPTLTKVPETATVTYSTANPKLLRVDENGEVFMINSGKTSVTATMVVGGVTYTASYDVTITAEDALYEVSSSNNGLTNTYKFVGAGKLPNRNVKDIPGLTVEMGTFGIQPQTTIVREDISNYFTATTLDVNGFRHLWANVNDDVITPYQGTFYTFKPTSDGRVTIKGRVQGNYGDNKVLLIEEGKPWTEPIASLNTVNNNAIQTLADNVSLEAGKTYYVYGLTGALSDLTGDEDYVIFELNEFSFTIENYFQNATAVDIHAETATNGCTSYTTECYYNNRSAALHEYPYAAVSANNFISNSYSAADFKFKGNVTGADISFSNGQIVFSNITYNTTDPDEQGGAIVTRVGTSEVNSILFVLTIPYGKHTWLFQTTASSETVSRDKILANTSTFDGNAISSTNTYLNYMVRTYTNRVLTYLKDPVWANVTPVKGTNAYYIDQTAGLVFNTQAGSFGSRCLAWSADQGTMTNEERRDQDFTNSTRQSFVSWHTPNMNDANSRASVTIPQLKKGWFVRIWWNPESNGAVGSGGAGVQFLASNLTDLDGKSVDSDFHITGSVFGQTDNLDDAFHGNTIFRVKEDGDVTIWLHDNGWNDLVKIEVSDSYATDFIFSRYLGRYREVIPSVYGNCYLSHKKGEEAQLKLEGANHHNGESARYPRWTVIAAEGVTEGTDFTLETKQWQSSGATYEDAYLTAISGYGCILIRQDMLDITGNYVTDRREGWFAIGEYEVQNYPYTWDFTDYNLNKDLTQTMTSLESTDQDNENYGKWLSDKDGLDIHAYVDAQSKGLEYYDSESDSYKPLTIEKPLFAKNSQLTINYEPIPETSGLRVTTADPGWWHTSPAYAKYDADNVTPFNNHVMLNGNTLTFSNPNMYSLSGDENAVRGSTITIPEVTAGMYVFVKVDKAPTVTIGGTVAELCEDYDAADGVYEYYVPEKSDVEISFPGVASKNEVYNLEAIGVTNISKSTNRIGYATESRDVPIDHVYTGGFTQHDVNAYAVLNYNGKYDLEGIFLAENAALVEKSEKDINVVPANTGVVLYDADNQTSDFPLFYPALNHLEDTNDDILEGNLMVAAVQPYTFTSSDPIDNVFIMSLTHYTYNSTTDEWSGQKTEDVEGFYRLRYEEGGSHNTIGANKAYMLLDVGSVALWNQTGDTGSNVQVFFAEDINSIHQNDTTDGIEGIMINGDETSDSLSRNYEFYTLSGVRINGIPTAKGIYICNGRKVLVK